MEKYWEEVKHKALDGMRRVVGQEVEDDCADMKRAYEYAKKHLSLRAQTDAADYFFDYKWAMHEIAAHEAK